MNNEYAFDMVLKKEYNTKYTLYTVRGIRFTEFTASTDTEAMEQAKAYMSCWHSVRINFARLEHESEKRN